MLIEGACVGENMDVVQHPCPACEEEVQDVLRVSPNSMTLRCQECGHVFTTSPPPQETMIGAALIISDGDKSTRSQIELVRQDEVVVGYEFDHEGHRLLVTGLESHEGIPETKLLGSQIRTLYAKVFDFVGLKLSLNEGENTRSFETPTSPEEKVRIGDVWEVDGVKMVIKTMKSDLNRTLHKGFLLSRNVRRAFCDPAPEGAVAGDQVAVRPRGKAPDPKLTRGAPLPRAPRVPRVAKVPGETVTRPPLRSGAGAKTAPVKRKTPAPGPSRGPRSASGMKTKRAPKPGSKPHPKASTHRGPIRGPAKPRDGTKKAKKGR